MLFLFLLFLILLGLGIFIFLQYQRYQQANDLYNQARKIERKDTGNPHDITRLTKALKLYQQCCTLVNSPIHIQAVNQCQKKIDDRKRFKNLLALAQKNAKQGFFKEALDELIKAKRLFITKELEAEISKCTESSKHQEKYEKVLEQSSQIAQQGQFQEAINLLKPALYEFDREDGQKLLTKLERVIKAKELYNLGLIAENKNNVTDAIANYEQAISLLPEFTECKIRLGIVTAKENPNKAISYLEEIEGQQAAYIRGFAHAQLGNWQQANREWKSIHHDGITSQRAILKSLTERDRLLQIKEIESAVDNKNFEIAKTLSLELIAKFGSEPTVQQNLQNHIQPLLERQIWEAQDWQQIAVKTEEIWLEQQDINSLHNWGISTYYQAQTNSNKLADFIIAWSTALANIEINPALQNIPWLGNSSIDLQDVSSKLKQMLENAIDAVKDDDIEEYLKLRDIYRRDMVTLYLIQQNNCGMRIKQQLLILPGCYEYFRSHFRGMKFPLKVWGALYTDWGKAIAACHEGDVARAIKIKPSKNPSSEVDDFAYCFVSYHEGCYYLQNLEWRKAINPLRKAQSDIKNNSDWRKEIDRLCELQRQKISDYDEHLQFSQFWYELLDSKSSRSYFAEQKAIQVAQKLDDKKISLQQGLNELKEIRNIDPNNSSTLDLIKKVEYSLEAEKIDRLWRNGQYEEAVRVAKSSKNQDLRFRVAEICLGIILEQLQSGNLSYESIQALNQIAQWAYELCPYEPAFQPMYRQLREIGIRC
ncbi:MAG: tetratricopeptide repeat protein [Xenococcaceae cyanobacterium MO_167.B27]|nr:tetratricopeptide repeat protein [Xenococcaceae cyanobacterium MO_167.B27]